MKKSKEEAFKPSKYQQDIFDFILNGNGNLVVEAVAGSGKTSTILESLKLLPKDKKAMFLAFNRSIADNLKKKTKQYKNVQVLTTYALGFHINQNNFGIGRNELDQDKYINEFKKHLVVYTPNSRYSLGRKWRQYENNVKELLNYSRLNLAETTDDIIRIAKHYEILLIDDEVIVINRLMEWGKKQLTTCDFTDMIWYPNIFDVDTTGYNDYDFIFVDEAQDLSKAQRNLILKCGNDNTRYIFVGDSKQAIYGFGGADSDSFKALKELPNTSSLPLSVCYRCPKTIIKFVKDIVPQIEHAENALEGEIRYNKKLSDINDGDMILCRNNAPLMQIYNSFLRMGKKAYVVGKDIGDSLTELVMTYDGFGLNQDLKQKGLFSELYRYFFKKRDEMMRDTGFDAKTCYETSELSSLLDKIESLKVLSEGFRTTSQLLQVISRVFVENEGEGIRLCTVHRAKGLEFNNVFIAKRELFSPANKKLEWEKIQERNLEYVAYTRTIRTLSFIRSDEIVSSFSMPLKEIEERVKELYDPLKSYGKNPKRILHDSTISGLTTPGIDVLISGSPMHISTSGKPLSELLTRKKSNKRKTF